MADSKTLQEEKVADETFSSSAIGGVNDQAAAAMPAEDEDENEGDDEDEDEDEDEDDEDEDEDEDEDVDADPADETDVAIAGMLSAPPGEMARRSDRSSDQVKGPHD